MESTHDVFGIWPDTSTMALEIGEKPDTVYRWSLKRRIPETAWREVITAAFKRGRKLTADDLLTANAPMKQRGRPAHKVRRLPRKRGERSQARA